jgi:hypothetical protein
MPANRKPGEDVIMAGAVSDERATAVLGEFGFESRASASSRNRKANSRKDADDER